MGDVGELLDSRPFLTRRIRKLARFIAIVT